MKFKISLCVFMLTSYSVWAEVYQVPPSSATKSSPPVISDDAMEKCVKVYNQAIRLESRINQTYVNNYDQNSVNQYNGMINEHRQMTNYFNQNCAGKQSRSAYEAVQKLNKK